MDQFCTSVDFLYYFFHVTALRIEKNMLAFTLLQKLQISKNTNLYFLEMQSSFLTFIFQQSVELLQCS